jgi:hypothetical protein
MPGPRASMCFACGGGREFTVTRTYKKNLRLLAQLWIDMEGFDAE